MCLRVTKGWNPVVYFRGPAKSEPILLSLCFSDWAVYRITEIVVGVRALNLKFCSS